MTSSRCAQRARGQLAAAFEWHLDLVQKQKVSSFPGLMFLDGQIDNFMKDLKQENLPVDSNLVRFPMTLHQWYRTSIDHDQFVLDKDNEEQITAFIDELDHREDMRSKGIFPLPEFSPEFRKVLLCEWLWGR